jgi:diacylglycerol kinase (ATP)
VVRLDAGVANGRLFALMASCGFDAEVVRRLQDRRRGAIAHLTYVKPILAALRSYDYPAMRVRVDGNEPGGDWALPRHFLAFNLPCYAFGLGFAPAASAVDGELDWCAFQGGSTWTTLRYAAHVWSGRLGGLSDHRSGRARSIWIESDAPVPLQLDGEPAGHLPAVLSVAPRRLSFVVDLDRFAWQAAEEPAAAQVAFG